MHHIASDGWSTSIIGQRSGRTYMSPLRNSGQQTCSRWRFSTRIMPSGNAIIYKVRPGIKNWVTGKRNSRMWQPLQLPTDFPRPAIQTTRGATAGFQLSKDIATRVQSFSNQHGATLFMTLLAAFKVLLHRYSGQEDITVGTPVANRTQQETEDLIGFFVNTLALRSEVKGEETFTQLLQQLKATTLDAYSHQDVPFEKVVEAVTKSRDLSRSPLFQVLFVLQNTPDVPELKFGDVKLSSEGSRNKPPNMISASL